MPAIAPREAARRMTHACVGLLALGLRWLPWPAAIACCFGGILLNFVLLPRVAPQIFRPGETRFIGVRAYPLAVLLLVVLFPLRAAAGAWAVLALGDAMAALVGRTWGSSKLPWNRDKSWQGLAAFLVFGACSGAIAYAFVEARPERTFGFFGEIYAFLDSRPWMSETVPAAASAAVAAADAARNIGFVFRPEVGIAAVAAAACAAFAESIAVRIDDNFRTAITAGVIFTLLDPLAASYGAA
ncbi:MAG: hypothetical protein JNJ88_05655 [Planctomycetes bacterium]|nr:hypothetical protein [Planctomycetota bacterium]